ncbi:Down syndrome cell adhesion molecule-like protein Dscam2 isoform X2 [Vespa velutina]|uniref:Down syndrome cell adhesion molecule-like protein Dscam2 isoform X2 n=1 Tax=Vespa velutina TaxID=202808 RepID=UPI001FB25C84|nr:Down syndrome cell adhesion molecule-like protein Dscam2 isoform X2 [Vespa velutina]XP_047364965.1 Down syndrome cell adhesion molecule-like protein Dscam2 isoform X2 [Vespa velutina]XP_047364966.1 Down syndrome cell adhesion molecule-like protein Dscam2 isoform X2 [Vespa velutina]XP_047364967.1 Down syndrome cell adhesion molecule-like protein Dscam2 isoform X2 [Vespa velutina]XP_047364968.1 Down syndrome cell adhesion molecule-like protein Dscam2 isoform X2 [Vespa velutina]
MASWPLKTVLLFSALILVRGLYVSGRGVVLDSQGPVLVSEPRSSVEFSNDTGAMIHCSAHGSPSPRIDWLMGDGSPVLPIPHIRDMLANGSMHFLPFGAESYRHDVHSAVYRCQASNSVGRVLGREITVKAVVRQKYEVQVRDAYVLVGNTGVLRCEIPSFAKDYVKVTSWVQDSAFNIFPTHESGGKYHMLPTGELLVFSVTSTDAHASYRCRTVHHVTGDTVESSSYARLVVTEHRNPVPPRFNERVSPAPIRTGETIVLSCISQGIPPPTYLWFRESVSGTAMIFNSERIHARAGVLILQAARPEDAGRYVCHANNTAGSERVELEVSIISSISIHLTPQQVTVDLGKDAEFQCSVTGRPLPVISWAKDGLPVREGSSGRTKITENGGSTLHISSIVRDDKGMYQCFAKNDYEMVQATAELRLGDAAPQLLYKFIEQTIQPGPSVSLKCIATGNPTPHFSWTLDGFPLPQNDRFMIGQYVTVHGDVISHVNISAVHVEDGGEYQCSAVNRVAKAHHSARLNIYGLPHVRPMGNYAAVAGETTIIKCPVAGFPIASITWEKDGQILPTSRRQEVSPNGTLVLHRVDSSTDRGAYTCTAKNKQGRSDSQTVHIEVKVPPTIAPFSFNKDLSEGVRAQVTCMIEKGDPPFTIIWSKDGEPIGSSGTAAFGNTGITAPRHSQTPAGLRVTSIDVHSSSIVIDRVTAEHTGNYTCLARNSVAEVVWTAELVVRVPPRWVMEPQDVRASEGMSRLVLHCHAEGFPPPAITWRRATGKKPGNYYDIASHEHTQDLRIHSNGSLVFGRVQEDHEGFYLCEALNGIGAGLSKVVYLTVNVPAHFVEKHRNQTARLGSNASLRCEAKGDHPLKISWRKGGLQIEPTLSDYRYTLKEENTTDGLISVLGFASTSREDSGRYFCIATNAYGRDETTIHLYIQEPPDFPRNLHVIEKGSRYIKIGWTTSQDGNSPITQYIIEYKTDSEVWHDHTFHTTVSGSRAYGHVSGLRPAVTYQFRVYAENELGRSQASDILDATTDGEKPGGPPRNLKVEPVSSTEFNVTWDPPDHDLWNGEILGYHVGYKEHRLAAEQYTYRTVERRISTASVALGLARTSLPGRQYQLMNLKKFTRYSVVVQAYNTLGQGPVTPEIVATTLEDVPSNPPQDVRCTALSSQSLQLSWDPPPDSSLNGILKGYKVMWENMDSLTESSKSEMKITTALTVVIHSLEKYTNYSVQALAFTRAGDGVASAPLYCVTEEDFPEVPAGVKAVASSATSIIVSWLPPLRSNGNITSYNVHIRSVGADSKWFRRAISPHQTSYQAENLHKRNQYEFSIAAITSVGEGPKTPLITVSPSSEVRAAIYSFGVVLIVPWKQDVTLSCQSVGKPEPSVIWKQWGQMVKSSARISMLPDGSLQITELHREDSGNYTCFVENRHGSDQITHRLTVQVPPAAPLLHATSATSNSINVQWKNGDDGGAPIRGYILHYKRESGEWEEVKVSHKMSSFVLSRLWCGNDYQMYLTAYNRIGMGSPSEIVKARTEGSKPEDSPGSADKFITVNVSWITLHLSTWNDGGCPITYFELEFRKNGEDIWTLVSSNIEVQKTYTLSELQPGTTYDIRIRAHNNAGSSVVEYKVTTLQLHVSSTIATIEIDHFIPQHTPVYSDLKLIVPLILSSLAVIAAAGAVFYCFRKLSIVGSFMGDMGSLHDAQTAAALDNKQNMEQREQYYATVRKPLRSPIREMATLEKIPEYSEDIYPYATFQLEESVPAGGDSRCNSAAPLQTFVYHDPRLSTADTLQLRESDCNRYTKVRGGRSSSAPLHKTHKVSQGKSESEEYDTLGSDSDTEVGTSSRTESSNHLVDSHHSASAADSRVHNFLYHGPESSTSTEPSPILERKSFPGRGRPKMLRLARHPSEETRTNFGPITGIGNSKHQSSNSCTNRDQERDGSGNLFVPKLDPPSGFSDAFELSEAECDLDRGHCSQRNVRDFVIAV